MSNWLSSKTRFSASHVLRFIFSIFKSLIFLRAIFSILPETSIPSIFEPLILLRFIAISPVPVAISSILLGDESIAISAISFFHLE